MQSNNPSNLNRLAAGYTLLAPFYSWLTRLVYGKNFKELNVLVAEQIDANATILIIGGGDGKIIEALLAKKPNRITYIEMSTGMLREAQKEANRLAQKASLPPIYFVHEAFPTQHISELFDTIITPFVCDTLEQNFLKEVFIPGIEQRLKPTGKWINLDFRQPTKNEYWYILHLTVLHAVFKVICGLNRTFLPKIDSLLSTTQLIKTQNTFIGWFEILVYQKR